MEFSKLLTIQALNLSSLGNLTSPCPNILAPIAKRSSKNEVVLLIIVIFFDDTNFGQPAYPFLVRSGDISVHFWDQVFKKLICILKIIFILVAVLMLLAHAIYKANEAFFQGGELGQDL